MKHGGFRGEKCGEDDHLEFRIPSPYAGGISCKNLPRTSRWISIYVSLYVYIHMYIYMYMYIIYIGWAGLITRLGRIEAWISIDWHVPLVQGIPRSYGCRAVGWWWLVPCDIDDCDWLVVEQTLYMTNTYQHYNWLVVWNMAFIFP